MITVMASVMIVQTALIYQVQHKTSIARTLHIFKTLLSFQPVVNTDVVICRRSRYWCRSYVIRLPGRCKSLWEEDPEKQRQS